MSNMIWTFNTANFEVFCEALPEDDPDLSWADEETLEKLDSGVYVNICWHVGVKHNGKLIGEDYLGNSVYENPEDFVTQHYGLAPKGRKDGVIYMSYFPGMVKDAIAEARKTLNGSKLLKEGESK